MKKQVFAVFALCIVAITITSCTAGPTYCEPKGKGMRCGKDNAPFEKIRVISRKGDKLIFRLGMWISTCGQPGTEYFNEDRTIEVGKSVTFDMHAVGPNMCREAFIFDCKKDGQIVDCTQNLAVITDD